MQITEHDTITDLQRRAKVERDGRVRTRLQGIILARQGWTSQSIGDALNVESRTVRDWAQKYNDGGIAALEEQGGRGRKAKLQPEDEARFRERIEAGAQSGDAVCSLRGLDIVDILKCEFGVDYGLSGVYRLLHRLGYSSLVPRPQHAKADPVRQESFKKRA